MSFEKHTPAVSRTAKPINRKPRRDDDDDDVIIPAAKKTDPFAKMLDRPYQAQFGGSYEQAYTKIYTDPSNRSIVDAATSEHLAQGHDNMFGYQLSGTHVAKAAPPDPPQDEVSPGPAHDRLGELIITRMRNEPNLSHAQAFTREYLHPGNLSLKQRYDLESEVHARRLASGKPFPAYGNPGDTAGSVGHTVGHSGAKPKGYAGG
jgi:hypothetical protein